MLPTTLAALPFDLVDVFAEAPLAGNPLAVVRVETMPSAALRQAFARETNLSETTFVATRPDADGHWPVRIHTPAVELPFAGHPTLGTAWVVAARLGGGTRVTLATGVGPVPVDLDGTGAGALAWLDAPPVERLEAPDDERIAAALALATADLDGEVCVSALADVGPRFVLVGLAARATLAGLVPDANRLTALLSATGAVGLLAVAPAGPDEGDLSARMFFEAGGVREDPATGSAACCLAAVLRAGGRLGRVELTQGVEMLRPSRLRLELDGAGDRIGGRVFPVLTGELTRELSATLAGA
ncbi:MAG TPA: PhzF family phenazine biosynthesis protein [Pseudomonadales bacterium]|nr:PhzF family phenazine biosynthesis protein [Pseudomonadales bacterium]